MNDTRFGYIPSKHFTTFKQEAFSPQQINKPISIYVPRYHCEKSAQSKPKSELDLESRNTTGTS